MILLWGVRGDPPLAGVAAALARRSADVAWLDQRSSEVWLEYAVANGMTGRLCIDGRAVELSTIDGAYLRPFDTMRVRSFRGAVPEAPRRAAALLLDDALLCWAELTGATVLNRPSAMASNNAKPYQLSLMRRLGLRVPETLVTTDPSAAEAFWRRYVQVVYKSVSGVRSRVARLDEARAASLADVVWCPTQFQQYVPGEEFRVHVVGRRVFAARVVCAADDYRYCGEEDVEVEASILPAEVQAVCLRAAHGLSLPLAGIDLRRTPDGEWYALEVNPSPGFTYYAAKTGQPIAEAVADLLLQRSPSRYPTRPLSTSTNPSAGRIAQAPPAGP